MTYSSDGTRVPNRRRILIVLAVVGTVLLAGCAGWGTDGPVDGENGETDAADEEIEQSDATDDAGDGDGQVDKSESGESAGTTDSDSGSDSATGTETDSNEGESEGATTQSTDTADTSDGTESTDSTDSADSTDATSAQDDGDAPSDSKGDAPPSDGDGDEAPPEDDDDASPEDDDTPPEDGNGDAPGNGDDDGNGDDESPETDIITVEVYNLTGTPLSGAEVTATAADGDDGPGPYTAETNADGIAELEVDASAEYIFDVTDDAHHDSGLAQPVSPGETVTIEMEPVPVEHTIVVVDQYGEPIEGADVMIEEIDTVYTTDENGEITREFDPYGSYSYGIAHIEHDDYETKTGGALDPVEGGVSEYVLQPLNGDDNEMYETSLTVSVVDQDGEPVAGETVTYHAGTDNPQTETTDSDGVAVLTGVYSEPDGASMSEVEVRNETRTGHFTVDGYSMEFVVEEESSAPPADEDASVSAEEEESSNGDEEVEEEEHVDDTAEPADGEKPVGDNDVSPEEGNGDDTPSSDENGDETPENGDDDDDNDDDDDTAGDEPAALVAV